MTNEQILKEQKIIKYIPYFVKAMDAARKDEAIAFNRWRDGEGWECELHDDEDVKHWQKYGEGKLYTDEELYQLFKSNQNK